MFVKFWGTRGSLPRPSNQSDILSILKDLEIDALKNGIVSISDVVKNVEAGKLLNPLTHGGDTSCVEIGDANTNVYVDMGSGLRSVGTQAMESGTKEFHIFLTHMHWDHVIGMPFFRPVFTPGCTIHIYHVHDQSPDFVKVNFNGINFPLLWEDLVSTIKFHKVEPYKKTMVNTLAVTPFTLDHPGHSYGYRFESENQSVVIGFDSEYTRFSPEELGQDLRYYQNLDLLIFDGQYSEEELKDRKGWGHSTPTLGTELALREGIKNIAFTHHDPWSDRNKLESMRIAAEEYKKKHIKNYEKIWTKNKGGPNLIYAYDSLYINLNEI